MLSFAGNELCPFPSWGCSSVSLWVSDIFLLHIYPLVLTGKDEKMVTVRLHACPAPGLFKPSRFYPSKNNVRTAWFMEQSTPKEGKA